MAGWVLPPEGVPAGVRALLGVGRHLVWPTLAEVRDWNRDHPAGPILLPGLVSLPSATAVEWGQWWSDRRRKVEAEAAWVAPPSSAPSRAGRVAAGRGSPSGLSGAVPALGAPWGVELGAGPEPMVDGG